MRNPDNILDELRQITPALAALPKPNTYSVPNNYFINFKTDLLKKVRANEVSEELKSIAPFLSEIDKQVTGDTPVSYFKSLPEQILNKVSVEENQQASSSSGWLEALNRLTGRIVAIIFKPRFAFAIAGSVSLVFVALLLFTNAEKEVCAEDDVLCRMENISNEELDAYFFSHPDDFQKSVLDYSTDDKSLRQASENIDTDIEQMMKQLDDEALNEVLLN